MLTIASRIVKSKGIEYAEQRAGSKKRVLILDGSLETCSMRFDSGFCVQISADGELGFTSCDRRTKTEAKYCKGPSVNIG